jgi:hypothetical protein
MAQESSDSTLLAALLGITRRSGYFTAEPPIENPASSPPFNV